MTVSVRSPGEGLTAMMLARTVAIAVVLAATVADAGPVRRTRPPPPPAATVVQVFGNDPCPKGVGDEIVVCARQPESERYRIPKKLRDQAKTARKEQSWVARARDIDETSRDGRPNSCSSTGSGGQTGCWEKFMRDARAQREADAAATVP